ncbi:hypothetical protein [Streptomyces rochei]|uniref:hypothetical protein n=1 Tax=Streptomyces rochei TaxID=1928 RepID=UPI0036F7A66A
MFTHLPRPRTAPADWPDFLSVTPLPTSTPLPADEWPALALTWQMVTPHVLHPDRGNVISAWLIQPGAPGPVAVAYQHRFNRSHPYGWQCGVHVHAAPLQEARYAQSTVSYDCQGSGITRTPEAARDAALRHIEEQHQDAAVPYTGRVLRARYFYA